MDFVESIGADFFSILADPYVLKIVVLVNNREHASFSQLKATLKVNSNSLSRSLKKLVRWKMLCLPEYPESRTVGKKLLFTS
jgi:DNA-binding HxlR family transcriptional regulator